MFLLGVKFSKNKGYFILKHRFPNCKISKEITVEGDANKIYLGKNSTLEGGTFFSTSFGGNIYFGENCVIRRGSMVMTYGGDIHFGDRCGINSYVIIYGHGGLKVGSDVWFATHSIVIPANHTFLSFEETIYSQPLSKQGISIGNDVWVGAGAKILDGVVVGNGVVIGAGAVVTTDIPDYSICVGIPAKVIKSRLN